MSVIRKKKDDDIIIHTEQPISLSLKVVIYLGIVSGIFIGSLEIVNNIPKYEYFERNGEMFMINKTNGDLFGTPRKQKNRTMEDGKIMFQHIGKIKY